MQQIVTPIPVTPQPASILVVEDEASVAMDIKRQLEAIGYHVTGTAARGEEAIMVAREKKPSLVLMGILIKESMDSIEMARHIIRGFNIPVVFLVSSADPATIGRVAGVTPYGYLIKPFQTRQLHAAIEVALYKSQLERQLSESEQWFAATLRCVGDALIVTDTEARITYLNPVAEALTGWTMEEARDREVEQVLRLTTEGAARAPILSPSRRALREGRVAGIEHGAHLVNRDGVSVPVDHSAAPLRSDDGKLLGTVVMARDVSERRRQEEQIRANEERARQFFDLGPPGMALVAFDGRFLQANAALARTLGYELNELLAQPRAAVSYPGDLQQEQDHLHQLLSGQSPTVQFEKRYLHHNGKRIVWTLTQVSVLREAGQPVCYLYQIHDINERKQAEYQPAHFASHDVLTGLANQAQLRADLDRLLAQARRYRQSLAVVFLDLDNFKRINDDLGHEAGDELLKTVAIRLKGILRGSDCMARLGGDEFALVLPQVGGLENIMRLLEKLRAAVLQPLVLGGRKVVSTLSAGVSFYPEDGEDAYALLRNADHALYAAKAGGRNRVEFFRAEQAQRAADWLDDESALRRALYLNELLIEYQPIVNIDDGHIVAFEALLRWRRGAEIALPSDFLSMAKETGLIVAIGEWMLREACSAAAVWMAPLPLHVNWSGPQLKEDHLAEMIAAILEKSGLPAERLCLELTESLILDSDERQQKQLAQLQALGVTVSIDDCGTGHSSLSHLKRHKPQTLNLDIQFVRDIAIDANSMVILAATTAIAHKLGLKVVAKGVETAEQASRLRACGCDLAQGFYYSRPVTVGAVADLIHAGRLPLGR